MADWTDRFTLRDGRIGRVLIAFMALGFVALLAAGGAAVWATVESQRHTRWVAHTYDVEVALANLRGLIEQTEATRRGALLAPENPYFIPTYLSADRELSGRIRALNRLTSDNPRQQRNMREIERRLGDLRAARGDSIRLVTEGETPDAIAAFRADAMNSRMRGIRTALDRMQKEERALLRERDAQLERSVQLFYLILGVAGVVLLLLAIVSAVTINRYTQDLQRSRDILQQLNDSLEEIVEDRTADLSRANEEIQRFAYIVSHDLRSPLVNVMGFTAELEAATGQLRELVEHVEAKAPDLVGEEARLAAKEDLPEAIGFIRTSTQKMDRLINAILALSRQGRRVLAPEPLDLAAIVDGIARSLAHRLDETGGEIAVAGTLPALTNDRLAIEQVLSNLIENSVKYRQPGRPVRITVRGGEGGARVFFEVADNGRGIDPRDHARVFDLFRRSGQQDQPGEGIGLAHVRALVYRLGGTIDLRSTLGEGSTFRVTLPRTLTLDTNNQDQTQ
ncbi:ATP-binding protein [Sphingomonas sp.]|uniref:sensor histidine kinase n=1 Tax=Sphingomonas sp. TaxID=28214 RepID=UPI0035C8553E